MLILTSVSELGDIVLQPPPRLLLADLLGIGPYCYQLRHLILIRGFGGSKQDLWPFLSDYDEPLSDWVEI